jgi:hypothetical protein
MWKGAANGQFSQKNIDGNFLSQLPQEVVLTNIDQDAFQDIIATKSGINSGDNRIARWEYNPNSQNPSKFDFQQNINNRGL